MVRDQRPLRTCVGCQRSVPATELIRFVLVAGRLRLDPACTEPGRGAWLHPDRTCLSAAQRRRGFDRSFRVRVDASVLDHLASNAEIWVSHQN